MPRERRNWTTQEDNALRLAVEQAISQDRPLLWRELAKAVPDRSNKDCRRRWWNSLADSTAKGPWSEDEDRQLLAAVKENGTNWAKVAQVVASRNSDQCSSHWSQVLDPSINFADWTSMEDEALLHSVINHGTNWATIAKTHVAKRSSLALKNRYSALRVKHRNSSASQRSDTAVAAVSDSPRSAKRSRQTNHNVWSDLFIPDVNEDDHIYDDNDDDFDDDDDNDNENRNYHTNNSGFESDVVCSSQLCDFTMKDSLDLQASNHLPPTNASVKTGDLALPLNGLREYSGSCCVTPTWTDDRILPSLPSKPLSATKPLLNANQANDELFGDFYSPSNMWSDAADTSPPIDRNNPAAKSNSAKSQRGKKTAKECASESIAELGTTERFRVSMSLLCESAQLGQVVADLADIGGSVKIEIEAIS